MSDMCSVKYKTEYIIVICVV